MTSKLDHIAQAAPQMKSTVKRGRIVTQSVEDVCKLSQLYDTPIQRTS